MKVRTVASIADLPPGAVAILSASPGLFGKPEWWAVVLAHAMPQGAEACFVIVSLGQAIVAVMPMMRHRRQLQALTTPYSCEFRPAFRPAISHLDRLAACTAFARYCRADATIRLDALPVEWEGLSALHDGAAKAGLPCLRFDHFGNWYDDVSGLDWPAYLQGRAGALRETIRRRLRRADTLPDARFELLTSPGDMDRAAEAFESVYARSWKEPEPYPAFNVALMRAMADRGWLRFGLWSIGGRSAAVQIWAVLDGRAMVLKLAHDDAYKAHSPGTVLTAQMLRHLLDRENVTEIDFGRGDDPYKKGWATRRRQRIGILLINPWRPAGAVALLRHVAGRTAGFVRRQAARHQAPQQSV